MKMIAVALLAAIGSPPAAPITASDVDDVIRNLDLTSFANSIGSRRAPGKATFADYGFSAVRKTATSANLLRKDDGRSKSFVITSNGPRYMHLCFHDRFVVMPGSASPLRYNTSAALIVTKSRRGLWPAQLVRGGFPNCHNAPEAP